MPRVSKRMLLTAVSIVALVIVRCAALEADPPPWLSWSGGLRTDEGFYTLDARHLALFGSGARGNFHDRLLSPLLSVTQQGAFALWGAGLTQARAVSVACGLLTVAALWVGLRLSFGPTAANAGALLLGFAPPFVLYNRVALQETPAAFCLTLSFALWASASQTGKRRLAVCAGMAAGLAFLCKTLAIVFFPALLWAAWRAGSRGWALVGGLGIILAGYALLWFAPHHTELSRMGMYYRQHQFVPHSAYSLWLNIRRAGVGDRAGVLRGIAPYLLLFVPVPCALAISRLRGLAGKPLAEQFLWLWLAGGVLFCCVSSYAPDRYYVLFLPPLCGLAGVALTAMTPRAQWAAGLAACLLGVLWLGAAWAGRTWTARDNALALARLLPARERCDWRHGPRREPGRNTGCRACAAGTV